MHSVEQRKGAQLCRGIVIVQNITHEEKSTHTIDL